MLYFHIMESSVVQRMVDNEEWDMHYTCADIQKSDDESLIAIVGVQEEVLKSFKDYFEITEYCYANGWTKPTYEDEI